MATASSSRRRLVSILVAVALVGQGLVVGVQPARAQVQTITCPAPGFGEVVIPPVPGIFPFIPVAPLATVPNPVYPSGPTVLRGDLVDYVANLPAAVQLGKAFFWDMQAGSDSNTACATCHFKAGADDRTRNQTNPGPDGLPDGFFPDSVLSSLDFPLVTMHAGSDDIVGSQGVRKSDFQGIGKTGAELTSTPTGFRQVTGMNTPTMINAVFNHRNFWNGRAQPEFNGLNPWGARDLARVWMVGSKGVVQVDVRIPNASLASQAVGPALNPVEMSAAGRTFPELGRKLLLLSKPLAGQKVDPTDSVLGGLADVTIGKGLTTSYKTLIQTAFQPKWWNYNKTVTVGGKAYSLTEANFSLFWGLAIMLYEGTLVSNQTPMDQYLATRVFDLFHFDANGLPILVSHDPTRLDPVVARLQSDYQAATGLTLTRDAILLGLDLFEKPLPLPGQVGLPPGTGVGCNLCHMGAEMTSASVRNLTGAGLEPGDVVFRNAGFDLRMERMFMGFRTDPPQLPPPQPPPPVPFGTDWITYDPVSYAVTVTSINGVLVTPQTVPVNTYDVGWYNVGVRPTADDAGLGGTDAFGKPLSWTELFQTTLSDPSIIKVPGGGLGCPWSPPAAPLTSPFAGEVLNPLNGLPLLSGPLKKTEGTDVAGSFKVPGLRNVELNGPYFHNGGKATLRQVVELYDDGGNFPNRTLSPLIRPLGMTADQINALVAFLVSLTDDRVLNEKAPFDHPELILPNGNPDGSNRTLAPVGRTGSTTQIKRFLNLNPFNQ